MEASLDIPAPTAAAHSRSQVRRLLETLVFVALWMSLGFGLHLDGNAYLVAGVPLGIAFQLLVARAPLRAAWLRDAPPFRWTGRLAAWALALALAPAISLIDAVHARSWSAGAWVVAGMVGALGAAYAISALMEKPRAERIQMLRWTLLAALPGVLLTGIAGTGAHFVQHRAWVPATLLRGFSFSLLQYLPICFALEEVVFRGVLDAHLFRPGDREVRWPAAILCAAWGLWHLPILQVQGTPLAQIAGVAALVAVVHLIVGLALTAGWRKSGSLLVPATAHAIADAVRNALMM